MPLGMPLGRHCILVLRDGRAVIDWGSARYQDLLTGEFLACQEADISHTALDRDLEPLKLAGIVVDFDASQVYLHSLPEPPRATLE